jgi:hypothetical protein
MTSIMMLNSQLVEDADGTKYWCLNGKLHREDGPAAEMADGTKYWYLDGKLHREDGPAIECVNGTKYWYQNDVPHREDGPAIEYTDGDGYADCTKLWYLNGEQITEEKFNRRITS